MNVYANIVTLKSIADVVLSELNAHQKEDPEVKNLNIIQTAAKLIRDDFI